MSFDLFERLAKVIGPEGVLREVDPASHYCRDWVGDHMGVPLAVLRPAHTQQVSEVVRLCRQAKVKMIPQGGHTGLVGGAAPSPDKKEVIITLERMNKVRQLDATNFSMIVDAGCVVEAVQAAAAGIDRYFPLSFGAQGSAHIGGAVATNAGGFNVLRYGMTRDLVLGLEVVLPDGEIWDGLSALRKNNTGYDLKQLFIGGEGTLGIVTAVALKIFPRQTQYETAFVAVESVEAAMALYAFARRDLSDLLSAFELLQGWCLELAREAVPGLRDPLECNAPYYVLLEASASGFIDLKALLERFLEQMMTDGQVIDGILSANLAQAKELWKIREGVVEAQVRRGPHLRSDVSVPISALAEFMNEANVRLAAEVPQAAPLAYGHVGDGNIHFNVFPPPGLGAAESQRKLDQCEEIIFEVIDRLGGSISAEHGIGVKKRHAFLQRVPPVKLELLRRLKTALDPEDLMSPGRII